MDIPMFDDQELNMMIDSTMYPYHLQISQETSDNGPYGDHLAQTTFIYRNETVRSSSYSSSQNSRRQVSTRSPTQNPQSSMFHKFQAQPASSTSVAPQQQCYRLLPASPKSPKLPRSSDSTSPMLDDHVARIEKRRAQNRASQRAYRQRKEQLLSYASRRVSELEQRVSEMDDHNALLERIALLEQQIAILEAENIMLQCQLPEESANSSLENVCNQNRSRSLDLNRF